MQQIIDNLKTLRNGLFKDEQAVIELIDETLKLVEQKASQFDAFVIPKIAEIIKLINERIEYYDYDIDCEYVVNIEKDEAFKTGALEALEDLKERLSNLTA